MIELGCFINGSVMAQLDEVISGLVHHILADSEGLDNELIASHPFSTETILLLAQKASAPFVLLQVKPGKLTIDIEKLKTMIACFTKSKTVMAYAHYIENRNGEQFPHPVINYQTGSVRDDFDFGPAILIKTSVLKSFLEEQSENYLHAGWCSLRWFLSRIGLALLFDDMVFGFEEQDLRMSGQKQFDYVDPRNRQRQIEMEQAATAHLEALNVLVRPPFKTVNLNQANFKFEASVIIPVLNRQSTITDAINSILIQQTNFAFNVIVIDNHSTDQTGAIVNSFANKGVIRHVPLRNDLGIGGCWNEGVNHPECGRFAIQLDSDDLYLNEHTLQIIVDKFREEQCAMVIGSYQMVNFDLEEIPPGVIDHREWTNHNGANNALRINGLGAPRAFFTPLIRQIGFPNVSYGEDYAVALAISRTYKVGRIYNPVYLCRRWEHNTDSNLSIEKMNKHNSYKDGLRSEEMKERVKG